jgi:hypothetical protein
MHGLRVCCPKKPDWGAGHVLADDGGARVTVVLLDGAKRTLDTASVELDLVTGKAAVNPILVLSPCQAASHATTGHAWCSLTDVLKAGADGRTRQSRGGPVRRRAAGDSGLLALANVARVLYPQSVCGARRATRRPRAPVP